MRREWVFLDSVGLLALWSERDQWHREAAASFARLKSERTRMICTTFVLLECGNAAARRECRGEVILLREWLENTDQLIHPTLDDWRAAWAAYSRRENAGAGIVDQTSIVVMRRLGIARVFGNDRHFRAAGMETLF